MSDVGVLREATADDIPILVKHRVGMARDIAVARGNPIPATRLQACERAYPQYAREHLSDGSLRAWVIEIDGRVVASGSVSLYLWPAADDPAGEKLGLLHSMYTESPHRRKGLARRLVEAAKTFCREQRLTGLILTFSEAGEPLYVSAGFKPWNAMRFAPVLEKIDTKPCSG